jgi:hypothetical protein
MSHGNDVLTDESVVAVLKDWPFIKDELDALGDLRVETMLELGVANGGSAVVWSRILPLRRYVGIDLKPLDIAFPRAVREHPAWANVRFHGNTAQDDREALEQILTTDTDEPLDLVIDDCSHQYEPSRRSFEILFPHLRAGGAYIIEDWNWAHIGPESLPGHPWAANPSLANLVARLVLLAATRPDVIARLDVRSRFVTAIKGPAGIGVRFDVERDARNPRPLQELI